MQLSTDARYASSAKDPTLTYPDSVRRVNPPKMTIPKTLAALPNNQYATFLLFVSGKYDLVFACVVRPSPPILLLSAASGESIFCAAAEVELCLSVLGVLDRKALRKGVWRKDLMVEPGETCLCRHRLQTKLS